MRLVRLPVSRTEVLLQAPTGAEDMLLLEAEDLNARLALALLDALVHNRDGSPINGPTLSVTDLDVLLLHLRLQVMGDRVRGDLICGAGCGTRVDVSFSVQEYLAHHRPRAPRGLVPAEEAGWYRLADAEVTFRLPSASDQIAIGGTTEPDRALVELCVRPANVPSRLRRRIETAMEAMAPSLCSELRGVCPECGSDISVTFDPLRYSLGELRARAVFLYEEVSTIAQQFHWSETDILAMPAARRTRYADLARRERSA